MKKTALFLVSILLISVSSLHAQSSQDQKKPKDVLEMASEEADRLGSVLRLEDWQIFYVDSILQTNLKGMENDIKKLGESRVSMEDLYLRVQDEWGEKTDNAFRKIFTEEQWKRYLRSGAQRAIKEREKRKKEMEDSNREIMRMKEEGEL